MNAAAVNLRPGEDQPMSTAQDQIVDLRPIEGNDEEYDLILQRFDEVNERVIEYSQRKKSYLKIIQNYELYYSNLIKIYKRDHENFEIEYKNTDQYVRDSMEKLSNCRMVKAIEHIIKTHQALQKFKK
jgi:hypothetical protein